MFFLEKKNEGKTRRPFFLHHQETLFFFQFNIFPKCVWFSHSTPPIFFAQIIHWKHTKKIQKSYGTKLRSPVELLLYPFPLPARWQQKNAVCHLSKQVPFFLLGMPYGEMKKSRLGVSQISRKELNSTQKHNMAFNDGT